MQNSRTNHTRPNDQHYKAQRLAIDQGRGPPYTGTADQRREMAGVGAGAGTSRSNDQVTSLYALSSHVPLIKSPAVRVPPPIQLPPTLHPLPPSVQEYFVYPFSLERFVLDAADRREEARRKDLQRRAPGWNETSDVLEPTRRSHTTSSETSTFQSQQPGSNEADEIAQMLDRLENM